MSKPHHEYDGFPASGHCGPIPEGAVRVTMQRPNGMTAWVDMTEAFIEDAHEGGLAATVRTMLRRVAR